MITRETGVGSALQPKYTGQGDGSFKGLRILQWTVANEKHIYEGVDMVYSLN